MDKERQEPSELVRRLRTLAKLTPPPRSPDSFAKLCEEIATDTDPRYDIIKEAGRLVRLEHLKQQRRQRTGGRAQ